MLRLTLPLIAALLTCTAPAQDWTQPKRAATVTAERVAISASDGQPAGELDEHVLRGLASLRMWAAWIPDQGLPQVVELALGAPRRSSVDGQVIYEASSAAKLPMTGAAGQGEVTLRAWSWTRPGWHHTEHHLEVANDSPWKPCGNIDGGVWRFALDTPGGYAIPRGARPLMLTPWWHPERPSFLQVDLPRVNLPDGNFRGAPVVIGWGDRALEAATRAHAAPDHGARPGALGTLWDVDAARGSRAAAKSAQARAAWLSRVETDPNASWGHRVFHGASGNDQWLFGQMPLPGLQEGGSNLAADYALLQVLTIEGRRPTWLDWAEMEAAGRGYFSFGPRPEAFYQYYRIHRTCYDGWARSGWTDNEFGALYPKGAKQGNYWKGPNHEHGFNAALYQLGGLTLHPVARDKALQHAARACAMAHLKGLDDGGYFDGGGKTDSLRSWCRQHACGAMGWEIALRWGLTDLAAQFDAYLSEKWRLAEEDPGGFRHATGNTGDAIPWANTPLSHNPAGQLRLEDIAGTDFDREPFRSNLRWVNTKAWWQTNQAGPMVLWALKTQNVHALTGLRDLAFQVCENVLGPIEDPRDLSDVTRIRIPKFGHPRVLGLGRGWQTPGKIPPAMHHQVIEGWLYETTCWAAIFDGHGVDGFKREQLRKALLAATPSHEWGQWGSAPPARWIEFARASGGVPDLAPLPPHTHVLGGN